MNSANDAPARRTRSRWNLLLGAVCLTGLTACSPRPIAGEDVLIEGETQLRDMEWENARVTLRRFLLDRPEHAGGHFYLGRAYLFAEDFRPAIAEGELQTALALFKRQGGRSPIPRFDDRYFELICNIESAKVCVLQIAEVRDRGLPMGPMKGVARRARDYVEAARAVIPESEDVAAYDELVAQIERALGLPAEAPAPVPPVNETATLPV